MRRQPQNKVDPRLPGVQGPTKAPAPTDDPRSIEPFLKSGGVTKYVVDTEIEPDFDPRADGVQLVTSVYVAPGRIGFLKQLRCAPFMPPVFADPWVSSGFVPDMGFPAWRTWAPLGAESQRAPGTNGVWTTPMGWESYYDNGDPPPSWRWHLRLIQGDITQLRAQSNTNIPPFDPANPASWYLVPDIPVPRAAYLSGIPGRAVGSQWSPQRMQVLQGDELCSHVMVPEDTTLALFTEWTQQPVTPDAEFLGEEGQGNLPYSLFPEYPLLPSFGQLHGYIQTIADAEAVTENARYGWGG